MSYKQLKTTRKKPLSNCKFTLQNRKIDLISINSNCKLYFAPNGKLGAFIHVEGYQSFLNVNLWSKEIRRKENK